MTATHATTDRSRSVTTRASRRRSHTAFRDSPYRLGCLSPRAAPSPREPPLRVPPPPSNQSAPHRFALHLLAAPLARRPPPAPAAAPSLSLSSLCLSVVRSS